MTKEFHTRLSEDSKIIYALTGRLERLEERAGLLETSARAVIAAGRPHGDHPFCECRKCKAHDALAALFEEPETEPDANPNAIYHDDRGDN